MILSIQYLRMILHNYFIIRNCSSRGPVVENDVEIWKIDPKLQKVVFPCFSERCHGNMCNFNVIVVLESISSDLYLLFVFVFLFFLIQFYFPFKIISAHMRRANQ